ncbi:MAG: ABC transporter transmembrane domain-containing protein, partial [Anaerolineaceae bacterium]|nr:ABC transporter transmembrane domain-containing protein [Anaerolineaceae bacterium]
MNVRRAWKGYLKADDAKPQVNRSLLKRVATYAKPYRWLIFGSLIAILLYTLLGLISPLILRSLIDTAIPNADIRLLIWCAVGIMVIPIFSGACQVLERRFSSQIGEGVIYDLRIALYDHLQRMSLRFFTHTQVGELISRLNNDVVDAQNAINRTLVGMVTNFIQVVSALAVMATLEWRLTLISAVIVPLFIIAA